MQFNDEKALRDDFPDSLLDALELWLFTTEGETFKGKYSLWLHTSEGGVDAACVFIQHLLGRFNPEGSVGFEWSNDCSKPRIDAYGGGAAFITAQEIKFITTADWLQEQINLCEQSCAISGS